MPAPPEFLDGARAIGIVEVFEEIEAEHPRKADRHVGIAREIQIDLHRIGREPEPRDARAQLIGRQGEDAVGGLAEWVGENHLLAEAGDDALDARNRQIEPLLAAGQLVADVVVAHDRPGDQLREEGNIEREVDRIALRLGVAAVDVDHIGQGVKGEEGNAERQVRRVEIERGQVAGAGEPQDVVLGGDKAGIFVIGQQADVHDHRARDHETRRRRPAISFEHQPEQPVEGDRGEHHEHEKLLAPRIEHQARKQQDRVPGPARRGEIKQPRQGEKQEHEDRRTENHRPLFSSTGRIVALRRRA